MSRGILCNICSYYHSENFFFVGGECFLYLDFLCCTSSLCILVELHDASCIFVFPLFATFVQVTFLYTFHYGSLSASLEASSIVQGLIQLRSV